MSVCGSELRSLVRVLRDLSKCWDDCYDYTHLCVHHKDPEACRLSDKVCDRCHSIEGSIESALVDLVLCWGKQLKR